MKHIISILIFVSFFFSTVGFAARKPSQEKTAITQEKAKAKSKHKKKSKKRVATKVKSKKRSKVKSKKTVKAKKKSKSKLKAKTKRKSRSKLKAKSKSKWNEICQDLLDTSVDSTLKLEKIVNGKKKISKQEFDEKIQNELLVVQLNAWVCASSEDERTGVAAEELFFKDYSKRVQSKKL